MRLIRRLVFAGWLVGLLLAHVQQTPIWRSDRALWMAASQASPQLVRPWVNLAVAETAAGDRLGAIRAWTAAKDAFMRDEGLPHPPQMRRQIGVALGLLLADEAPVAAAQAFFWAGCVASATGWACPPLAL